MSYGNVIMSSRWHTLPFLSHPDEIANFDFPHHAMALQRFRTCQPALAQSELRLCSANHRPGCRSNLPCDWPSTAWTYSKQKTENGPWSWTTELRKMVVGPRSRCKSSNQVKGAMFYRISGGGPVLYINPLTSFDDVMRHWTGAGNGLSQVLSPLISWTTAGS